jgi:hypothetical protein
MDSFDKYLVKIGSILIVSVTTFILVMYIISPIYTVWAERLAGEAELARAESNRQIKTLEAKAHEESSYSLANAEIIRAKGVTEANKIIGNSLEGNESYLRYLWIQGLQTNQMQVIYVPTEANLPILEAGKGR